MNDTSGTVDGWWEVTLPLDAAELAMAGGGTRRPGLLGQGEETTTEKINKNGRARTGPTDFHVLWQTGKCLPSPPFVESWWF